MVLTLAPLGILLLSLLQLSSGLKVFDNLVTYVQNPTPVKTVKVISFLGHDELKQSFVSTVDFSEASNNNFPILSWPSKQVGVVMGWDLESMKKEIQLGYTNPGEGHAVILDAGAYKLDEIPAFEELTKWMDAHEPQVPYVSYTDGLLAIQRLTALQITHKEIWQYPIRENQTKLYPQSKAYRAFVALEKILWDVEWPGYKPTQYVADFVAANEFDWADKETLEDIEFNKKGELINRKSHVGDYDLKGRILVFRKYVNPSSPSSNQPVTGRMVWVSGYPRFPGGRTGLSGRGNLGKWGPNHAVDIFMVRYLGEGCQNRDSKILQPFNDPNCYEMLALMREYKPSVPKKESTYATPGGMVNDGDTPEDTMVHEFVEECFEQNVEIKEYELWHTPIIIFELYKLELLSQVKDLQGITENETIFKQVKTKLKVLEDNYLQTQIRDLVFRIEALKKKVPSTDADLKKIEGLTNTKIELQGKFDNVYNTVGQINFQLEYKNLHLKLSVLYEIDVLRYSFEKAKDPIDIRNLIKTTIVTEKKKKIEEVTEADVDSEINTLMTNTPDGPNLFARNSDRGKYRGLFEFGYTEFLSIYKRTKEIEDLRAKRENGFQAKIQRAQGILKILEANLKKKLDEKCKVTVGLGVLINWRKTLEQRLKTELADKINNFRKTEDAFKDFLDIVGWIELYKGLCDDNRNTDNSWMETICYLIFCNKELYEFINRNLSKGATAESMEVSWHNVVEASKKTFFASHRHFITMFIKHIQTLTEPPKPRGQNAPGIIP